MPSFSRGLAAKIEHYVSIVAGDGGDCFSSKMTMLKAACRETRRSVRAFHSPVGNAPQYHEMLDTFLLRHMRLIASVELLIDAESVEHAAALVRMAYEAFLSFYLDWLSPGFFGPRLQLLSAVNSLGRSRNSEQRRAALQGRQTLAGFDHLIESVIDKARISPLGERFYNASYPALSWFTHQAYGVLEREAVGFDDAAPEVDEDLISALATWLDAITGAIVDCIAKDISSKDFRPPAPASPP